MKKILLLLSLSLASVFMLGISFGTSYAAWETVEVKVTEKIPGAGCSAPDADGVVTCQVGKWFGSVMVMIGKMIKYATFIASLWAVLFIVINGILYSMSGMDSGLKESAKEKIVKTLLGLIVLLFSGLILNAIAPWIYTV